MDLLAVGVKRYGPKRLAAHLRVKENQIRVYRTRGGLSAKRRLMLEALIEPPARPTDIPMEARYFTACLILLGRLTSVGDADALKAIFTLLNRAEPLSEEHRRKILDGDLDYFPSVRDEILIPGGFL